MELREIIVLALKFSLVMIPFALVPLMILMERRGAAYIQDRPGPGRAAIQIGGLRLRAFGMIHNLTDGVKLFFKESFIPPFANKWFYVLAPAIPVITAVLTPALIPWFGPFSFLSAETGKPISVVAPFLDANAGVLALFALGSLSVYGIVLGSWASRSKYALLGGMRASAMMISYEVSMGLSALGLFLLVGSFSLTAVVDWQAQNTWGIFVQPIGFLLFLTSMFAETNRNPFDVAEGESEIVAGFHTEYSGVKFALYFMGEYCHIVIASALIATLYLGGYDLLPFDLSLGDRLSWLPAGPYNARFIAEHLGGMLALILGITALLAFAFNLLIGRRSRRYGQMAASDKVSRLREYTFFRAVSLLAGLGLAAGAVAAFLLVDPKPLPGVAGQIYPLSASLAVAAVQIGVVLAKTLFFCWLFVWVRWTLPRFRYDQIMALGWKVMINIALVNLLVTAVIAKLVMK